MWVHMCVLACILSLKVRVRLFYYKIIVNCFMIVHLLYSDHCPSKKGWALVCSRTTFCGMYVLVCIFVAARTMGVSLHTKKKIH